MKRLSSLIFILMSFVSLVTFAVPASLAIPQGAIWNLRERGLTKEADHLEEYFKNVLLHEPITRVATLGGGFTDSHIVLFSNGIVAVLKEDDPKIKDSHQNEVAAYIMDKALGLNLVPLTVSRNINGKSYSLQLFYSGVDLNSAELDGTDYRERLGDFLMFDALIYNVDRDMETLRNIVMGDDGRLVAIDHARTFEEHVDRISYPEGMARFIPQIIREGVLNVDVPLLIQSLSEVFSPSKVQSQIGRLLSLKAIFVKLGRGPLRPVNVDTEPLPKKWRFELPKRFQESVFYDRFGIEKALTGSEFSLENVKAALKAANTPVARSYAFKLISKNIDRYPAPIHAAVSSVLLSGPYDNYLSASEATLIKIVEKSPQFAIHILRRKNVETSEFYSILQVLRNKDAKFMTADIRALMRFHFVEFYRENKFAMDLSELVGAHFSETKKAFLRDIYEDIKKAGLSDQAFEIFRLRENKNKELGLQLLESVGAADKEPLKNQLTVAYQHLAEKMGASSHFSNDVLWELRTQAAHPLCAKVLLQ